MYAFLRSVRIAPKKAGLLARMIRGMPVPDAVLFLERTNKKAARILEKLLRSAMANASHNDKQDPQMMIVKSVVVNQAQAYHRGVPMARGRIRPMRKFLSHITLTLGLPEETGDMGRGKDDGESATGKKGKKMPQSASQASDTPVQQGKSRTKTAADTPKKRSSSKSAKSSPSA